MVERDINLRTVELTEQLTGVDGRPITKAIQFTELQHGVHFKDPESGNWIESSNTIEPHPEGAIAKHGAIKVFFKDNINSSEAITVTTPNGQTLTSNVLGLAYYNAETGESVLLGEIKDSWGRIHGSNQVVYENAFSGVEADIRYTYTSGTFEQDVIIRQQLPDPSTFGFDPSKTRVEVLTEFVQAPVPKRSKVDENGSNYSSYDETIGFGDIIMAPGKAFTIGHDATSGGDTMEDAALPVGKSWHTIDNHTILIETVPFEWIAPLSTNLPSPSEPLNTSATGRHIPKASGSAAAASRTMLASVEKYQPHGVVIDYIIVTSQPFYNFLAGQTYLISNTVYIDGFAIFQGGAVIKFAKGASLIVSGSVYTPSNGIKAIFTARDDYTVGENISTGVMDHNIKYASTALQLYNVSYNATLRNLEIRHANTAIVDYSPYYTHTLRDSHFIDCETAVKVYFTTVTLQDSVLCDVDTTWVNLGSGYFSSTGLTHLVGTNDNDGDGLSNSVEMRYFLSDPLVANSKSGGSINDGKYFTSAGFSAGTEAQLTGFTVQNGIVTLTLSNARTEYFYDIFFPENVTGPWQLRYSGPATTGEGTSSKGYQFPIPNASSGFYQALLAVDSDYDGLTDGYEILVTGTIAGNPDTNGNDIPDGSEDFDNDRLTNSYERELRTDPFVANGWADSDGDGLPDWLERIIMDDPNDSTGANPFDDADGDGISNLQEFYMQTNPMQANVMEYHVRGIGSGYIINQSFIRTLSQGVTLNDDNDGVLILADIRNMSSILTFERDHPDSGDVTIMFQSIGMGEANFGPEYDEIIWPPHPEDYQRNNNLMLSITTGTISTLIDIAEANNTKISDIFQAQTLQALRQQAAAAIAMEYRMVQHWQQLGTPADTLTKHIHAAQMRIHTELTKFNAVSKRLQLLTTLDTRYLKTIYSTVGGAMTLISVGANYSALKSHFNDFRIQVLNQAVLDSSDAQFGTLVDNTLGTPHTIWRTFFTVCQLWQGRLL